MDALLINSWLTIPASELSESFARSGGPGGQNVNKVATKVDLRWAIGASTCLSDSSKAFLLRRLAQRLTESGELVVVAEEHRSQLRNREEARRKLAQLIRESLVRPKTRRATTPSRGSIRRRLSSKKKKSETKKTRGRLRNFSDD